MKFSNISSLIAAAVGVGTFSVPVHAGDRKCTRGDYGCGQGVNTADYWTQTCGASQCCCQSESFSGYRHDSCSGYESETKGCFSCLGQDACKGVASTVKIGDQSCVNDYSCQDVKGNSVIWNHSCRSKRGCEGADTVVIGPDSCGSSKDQDSACEYLSYSTVGSYSCQAGSSCYKMSHSTIGSSSCRGSNSCWNLSYSTVGSNSCNNYSSCDKVICTDVSGTYVTIGDNACNLEGTCFSCAENSIVPNGACSTSGADDVTPNSLLGVDEYCVYCIVSTILLATKRNPFHSTLTPLRSNTLPFLTRSLLFT